MNVRQKASRFAPLLSAALRQKLPGVRVWLGREVRHKGFPTLIVDDGGGRQVPVTLFIEAKTEMCPVELASKLIARLSTPLQAA
jgi:hypothetical protein